MIPPPCTKSKSLLIDSAESFIGFVANTNVDYRLAVVSTDYEDDAGRLQGEVLTPESTGMVDAFIAQIESERAGSRDERGFDAAILGANPTQNPEFARVKADLEVVIFSDEDDHSSVDASTFVDTLRSHRDNAEVKVHAVVGDPPAGCVSALAAADVGTRYLEVQAATEGGENPSANHGLWVHAGPGCIGCDWSRNILCAAKGSGSTHH